MKERDLIARAVYKYISGANKNVQILYRAGKLLDAIKDDEREKYYMSIQNVLDKDMANWEKNRNLYVSGLGSDPGPRPKVEADKILGPVEDFELDDKDVSFIKSALSSDGWWVLDNGSTEDPRICARLMDKFGLDQSASS